MNVLHDGLVHSAYPIEVSDGSTFIDIGNGIVVPIAAIVVNNDGEAIKFQGWIYQLDCKLEEFMRAGGHGPASLHSPEDVHETDADINCMACLVVEC